MRERVGTAYTPQDQEAQQDTFIEAPYIHQNNEPKYHATLLRAREYAKRRHLHCLWFQAIDRIHKTADKRKDPEKLKLQHQRFLQFHDQRTAGIPGMCPLFVGLCMRVTEKIRKGKTIHILKHTPCTVVGWKLDDLDHDHNHQSNTEGERFLAHLPEFIVVRFEHVEWQLNGFPPSEPPISPKSTIVFSIKKQMRRQNDVVSDSSLNSPTRLS